MPFWRSWIILLLREVVGSLFRVLPPAVLGPVARLTTVLTAVQTFVWLMSLATYPAVNVLLDIVDSPVVLPNLLSNAVGLLLLNIDRRLVQTLDVRFNSHRRDQPIFYFFRKWVSWEQGQEVK